MYLDHTYTAIILTLVSGMALALALVFESTFAEVNQVEADKFLFNVGGVVFLSLILNGIAFGPYVRLLGLVSVVWIFLVYIVNSSVCLDISCIYCV